jgi:transcription antitermination factor NusG
MTYQRLHCNSSSQRFGFENVLPFDENQHAWFAVATAPQNEWSVARYLDAYQIESFFPTYECTRIWKNRQRKKIIKPLFSSYIFVHADKREQGIVRRVPGVFRIVGGLRGPIPIPAPEIELLRVTASCNRLEPFHELVVGDRVRITNGPMQGVEGTLVRKSSSLRVVLTVDLINQHAAVEVQINDIEPITQAA